MRVGSKRISYRSVKLLLATSTSTAKQAKTLDYRDCFHGHLRAGHVSTSTERRSPYHQWRVDAGCGLNQLNPSTVCFL